MGWFNRVYSSVKNYVSSKISKPSSSSNSKTTSTTTTRELAPKTQDPVRVIDTNKGGITVRGKTAWGGSAGGGGGGTTVTVTSNQGVKQGGVTYSGSATVPNTGGKTASQLQQAGRLQAAKQGVTGSWSAKSFIPKKNKSLVSVTYSGKLNETETKKVLGSRGFTNAYIKKGGGTPTSPQAFLDADKEINKARISTKRITAKDVTPTTILGKSWLNIRTAYTASTLGMTTILPNKYHQLRETGSSRFINTLTWSEARQGILDQKAKEANRDLQIAAINKFNIKIQNAPEDVKYKYYQAGRSDLLYSGISTREENGELKIYSKDLTPSTSQNVYDWRNSKGNILARTFVATRAFSSEGAKFIFAGLGIGAVAGKTVGAIEAVAPRVAKGLTTTTRIAGYGALGVWGASSAYTLYKTPKQDRGVKYAEVGGQAFGVGTLLYGSYSAKKANKKITAENYNKKLRAEQLKNIKDYGQYSKYAKTSYKEIGTGRTLKPSVVKGLSKQFGVSENTIREGSVYKQYLEVRSPGGFKPYKTSKWGISISQGKSNINAKFRIYKGKPTSWEIFNTKTLGNYALTSTNLKENFITKTFKSSSVNPKSGVKFTGYRYETRKIPPGYNAKTPQDLWNKLGSTYKVSSGISKRFKISFKEGGYLFYTQGIGQPSIATKNIPLQDYSKFVPKPSKGFTRTPLSSTFKSTTENIPKTSSSTGNKGASTKLKIKNIPTTKLNAAPTVPIKIPKTQLRLTPLRSDQGVKSLLGVGSLGAVKNIQEIKAINLNKLQYANKIKVDSITKFSVKQIQAPTSTQITRTITTQATTSPNAPTTITPSFGSPTPTPAVNPLLPFGLALPSLGLFGGRSGYGRVKAKAKYGYTPSYTALAFGIVGKKRAPTIGKRYTGLEFRPITKEWTAQFKGGKIRSSKKTRTLFM